jgi:NitT/TauT family transport system substrate-binding protein
LAHKSPAAVVVKDESIQTPEDLEGKTVAATEGDVQNLLFPNFLEAVGLDPSSVEVTLVDGDIRTSLLLTGQVDAAQMFLTDDWLSARAQDPSLRAFGYSEYGVDHITTGILARNDLLEQQPEVARGFVRAILRAYAYAAAHPDEAVQSASAVYPENFESAETGAEQVVEFTKLMVTPGTEENGLGYSTPEEWESFVDILVEQGALEEADVRPVEEYYTNEFLPEEPVVMES